MTSPIERLRQVAQAPEEALDVAEAALVIAQHEYPALNIAAYLRRFDEFAHGVRERLEPDSPTTHRVIALNHFLFQEQGFSGNTEDYYDPRNSFLNEVLDRRLGIPITLAIIYIEVGRRLGLPLAGVSFPAHFLVRLSLPQGALVLDPYAGGIALHEEQLQRRLLQACGEAGAQLSLERLLVPAGKREILARMLRNLKAIYLRSGEPDKALAAIEHLLVLAPGLPEDIRDRGLVYEQLECAQAALGDLERYLLLRPRAHDTQAIRARLTTLQHQASRLH